MAAVSLQTEQPAPRADVRRWRRYLADERAEGAVYRNLAARRSGEEREILAALAEAEGRHEQHWLDLLGDDVGRPQRGSLRTRVLATLAKRFGSVFVLALMQRAEDRSPYADDDDATASMAADERIHGEVVRGLANRGRMRLSGTFRAAVFGANDGLVSNLALIIGISASGADRHFVLLSGIAGLLAGALSMGAGEYVSVRSQRELLEASAPHPEAGRAVADLDVDANELALVYRARGMAEAEATEHAAQVLSGIGERHPSTGPVTVTDDHEAVGNGLSAAVSSFLFFASGAIIPVLPFLFGMQGWAAIAVAGTLVGLALLGTGAIVGVLSGASPGKRAFRQLAIGIGAAVVTYALGLLFGTGSA
ncbi:MULTISPECIES: VIT1/CCC1 transporter family protein [unclassified Curtobacterium]|uniref:VIT1/CCC1 transporter family protein n=1 Tax=unclassified Curtobacterium TaxID=257496 RepID=UPI000F4A84A1|nr:MULTISPECIES: VIT1/CCC1 transporter family protein [unclassified Curtobacterium]ROQ07542.1 VIT1/CCC1 family predicted Fe2+/Mn2+ transporter [Curtobacterium sp. PhB171]ROQ23847.1 VIT1/CCC1 family predicted Fe2+/Mn2+ transporter [Curtobacterium sp. PhB170]ROS35761.1 VIT1/CCC1 family predicted Fe2+/Mn2+ transporter [Curtobacterium sp. PhB131]ROS69870.1 VIT1/CCC1 family predicted Fe2+/Mn2+ transporter [Curtobacterium sp. PhB141]